MSNFSRTACSLAPAYFHHCRSKSSIAASRSESSPALSGWELLSAWLPTIVTTPRDLMGVLVALIIGEDLHRCHLMGGGAPSAAPGDAGDSVRPMETIRWG